MSTLKKVLSLVLCFSLLAGSFAMLGDLAPVASAAETPVVKTVKSFAELDAAYDKFVYYGTEVREIEVDDAGNITKDNGITDGYVQPGQWLQYRAFIKSDMWVSTIVTGMLYDTRFFDAHSIAEPVVKTEYDAGAVGAMNPDHSITTDRGLTVKYTVKTTADSNQFASDYTTVDAALVPYLVDTWQTCTYDANVSTLAANISEDNHMYTWYVRVADDPSITSTTAWSDYSTWKITPLNKNPGATTGDPKVQFNVATGALLSAQASAPARTTCKNMNLAAQYKSVTLLLDDTAYTFVLGDPPAEAEKYAATFMNGETEVSSAEYEEGAAIVFPADPAAPAGKKFAGWAINGTVVAEYTMGTSAVTFVATFEDLPAQTATFMNGSEVYDTYEVYAGGKIVAPAGPAGENGSTFLHWSATEGGEAVADWTMPEDGATFYAVFSAAAVHAVNYVNGTETTSVNVVEGSEYTIAGAPEYDAEAYRFLGWSTVEGDASSIVTDTIFTMGAEDVTYYAVFEEIVYYTVSYFVDGAAYGEAVKYEENETYEVSTDEPAKTGYTFVGWSSVENNADAIISGEQTITSDVTLYAIYTVNSYNATFDANGGAFANGDAKATYLVEYNDYIVAPAEEPVKKGYKFDGWTGYTEGATIGAKDVTYKAKWTANTYKATFYVDKAAYDEGTVLTSTDATYDKNINLGSDYTAAKLAEGKPGYKFAGWADAATGELAANATVSSTVISKYAYDSDKAFYAMWTEYDSSITIMVRDYVNGEGWTVYETAFNDKGKTYNAGALKGVNVAEKMGWTDFTATVSRVTALYTSETFETAVTDAQIAFDGDATYYLNTTASSDLTFAAGEETQVVKAETNNANPYSYKVSLSAITLDTTPATGYKFAGWVDAEGNAINAAGGRELTVPVSGGNAQTIAADFQKIAYTISFNVNNAAGSYAVVKTADKTFSIGDTLSLEDVKYLNAAGEETELPIIGKPNGEQAGGDMNGTDGKNYVGKNGWTFKGWTIGLGENEKAFDLNGSETITEEFIKKFATGEIIKITGQWEALEQKLVFYIVEGVNEDGTDKYVELVSYDVATGDPISTYTAAATALAKEKLPAGKVFNSWSDTSTVNMPAGGLEIYARYQSKSLSVYIDYNNSTKDAPLTLEETMELDAFFNAYYGLDIKAAYPDGSDALYDQVRRTTITKVPGENYICVGWDVYTVEDGKDVYDKANWVKIEGIKDAESYKATSTLIFSANWKAYSDFFFRIYDTNHKITRAFGKDFKMYYWASEIATDRANADPINHLPDGLVIVLFIPTIEFEGGLTLAIEPFAVNKTFFDPRNFGALLGALGGLLGNLGNL